MVKQSIDAKVRPLANPGLEKTSLFGAARLYISKDSMIALTNGLESHKACVIVKLEVDAEDEGEPIRREASLCVLPEKNLSPNVVMMTRAFQDASGLRVGDQVRISLLEATPDANEVVVKSVAEGADAGEGKVSKHSACWEYSLSVSLERAEQVFPGMIFEGVAINKFRRTYKVLSVNGQTANLARFHLSTTTVKILSADQDESSLPAASAAGPVVPVPEVDLVITGVPGFTNQIANINSFLKGFGRPFRFRGERESCAFTIYGGHGTGKTFILKRLAATNWGKVFWIRPSDKLVGIRETFKLAQEQQPSMVLIDGLEEVLHKDRSNRAAVIDALAEDLDALSAAALQNGQLPLVVVVATCLDYMTDVPTKLQNPSQFFRNIALPIPRAPERLEILEFLDPPVEPDAKTACLKSIAEQTHAYNCTDLTKLVANAKCAFSDRLDASTSPTEDASQAYHISPADMEQALTTTRPSAMNDINLNPPTIHWGDIGGQDDLKKVLSRMIKNATSDSWKAVMHTPPKGALLFGPPGCSKTLSAQAMATESGFNFFAVKGAELLNMYVGESERALRNLFTRARAAQPSIIFFDEIDSIGGQRNAGNDGSASRSTGSINMLTTLLTEMDGFESLTGVLVLAATNRPEAMDPALMRPGRFDRRVYVGPPDEKARVSVFKVHLRGLAVADDVDTEELAKAADGYSGAEIKAICNEAGDAVGERHDNSDGVGKLEICMADLMTAMKRTPRNITPAMIAGYENWSEQF